MKLLRREFLMGLGLATVLASDKTESMVSGTVPSSAPDLTLPVNNLLSLMRMQSTLGNEDQVPWHYNGTLYFQKGSEQPIPMVKIEGMESYKVIPQDDGSYEILGNMLTFFRDVDSGEMIRDYRNPYTGKVNKVSPNIRRASLGRGMNISTMGSRPTSFIDQMPDKPLILDWTFGPKTVWLHNQTSYPPGLSPPRVQRMTMFAPLDEFLDPNNLSLSTMFTATVLMPWLPWMDMDDVEGHTLWHASGVKLDSIDQLPEEYSKRMMAEHPELSEFNLEEDTGPVIYE
tara:strand:+ start:291 stop:1148 length:858 start_codon:yes stop_codon:yes gene_type:complete